MNGRAVKGLDHVVVMVDGSVHTWSKAIDYRLFNNMGTKAGREFAPAPD